MSGFRYKQGRGQCPNFLLGGGGASTFKGGQVHDTLKILGHLKCDLQYSVGLGRKNFYCLNYKFTKKRDLTLQNMYLRVRLFQYIQVKLVVFSNFNVLRWFIPPPSLDYTPSHKQFFLAPFIVQLLTVVLYYKISSVLQ